MIPITILLIVILGVNIRYPNTTPYMLCVAVLYSFFYTRIINKRIISMEESIHKINDNVNCLHRNEKLIHSRIQKYERQNGKNKKNNTEVFRNRTVDNKAKNII